MDVGGSLMINGKQKNLNKIFARLVTMHNRTYLKTDNVHFVTHHYVNGNVCIVAQ